HHLLSSSSLPSLLYISSHPAYLRAAAIFQRLRTDKPITQRLLHYGKKTDTPLLESRDRTTQKQAYQLAFNTLRCIAVLTVMNGSDCDHFPHDDESGRVLQPPDLLPLAMVMLFDLQDRKFLKHERPVEEGQELLQEVRDLESCLYSKTKLAASLARCRVRQGLLSISCLLSDSVRTKQHRARLLPLYAWVNTLKTSIEEVCEALQAEGLCKVETVSDLKESAFCRDPLCPDTLVFSQQLYTRLQHSKLTFTHALNIQDRSVCVAVSALRPLLFDDSDVLVAGSFSALTVAHITVLAAAHSGRVLVCGADCTPLQREEIEDVLRQMDIKNVRILSEQFCDLDEWDGTVQRLKVIVVLPQCSLSALNDPVNTIHSEHGDCDLLQDLSQGSVSQSKLHSLATEQARLLVHALTLLKQFPHLMQDVQSVVYCTRSVHPEENEQLVKTVLENARTHPKLLPFSCPWFVSSLHPPSFLSFTVSQVDPAKAETVQDVLARAAAKGLLGGINPDQAKTSKKGRARKSHAPATSTKPLSPSAVQTEIKLATGQNAGGVSTLPVPLSVLKEKGMEDLNSDEEEDKEEGHEEDDGPKGERRRGHKGRKNKPKRRPKQTNKTPAVSKPRPSRRMKKAAHRKLKPIHNTHPRGPAKSEPGGQLPPLTPTQTPSPSPSHHSTPVKPLANTFSNDPPTMISQRALSGTGTPMDKHLLSNRPAHPTLHTASEERKGQKTESGKGDKTFQNHVAKTGGMYKATGKVVKPKTEVVMQAVLKPADFVLPPISSPSLSSLSSRSGRSASQLTQTLTSSSSVSLSGLEKPQGHAL
uniref:SAM-dependent MTase RsmB/NOP-type domain-containing protein n=1 Tax=Myripristis murdjan TaxID=586833 RepID=A0A667WQE3_9TELE